MSDIKSQSGMERLLSALSEQLASAGERYELVVIGGSGLLALGVVYFASRYDQIHFKLYALVDQGPGKHEEDLRALAPTEDELIAAAKWSMSQDPSEGYALMLRQTVSHLGVEHGRDLGA